MGEIWDNAEQAVKVGKNAVNDRIHLESLAWFDELNDFRRLVGKASMLVLFNNAAGSYKFRGAFSRTNRLVERAETGGTSRPDLVTASAGNAGIGLKYAAREYQLHGSIYVPTTIAHEKYTALTQAAPGADVEIIKSGSDFSEAYAAAKEAHGAFVEPFDHPDVMAGQGMIADDVLEHAPDVTTIITPLGGGGLATGLTQRLKHIGRTDIRVIAAEAEGSNSMSRSVRKGEIVEATSLNRYFGALAVRRTGTYTFAAARKNSHMLSVQQTTAEGVRYTAGHYLELHDTRHGVIEPSTAVALEALRLMYESNQLTSEDHVVVLGTGQNERLENLLDASQSANRTVSGFIGRR